MECFEPKFDGESEETQAPKLLEEKTNIHNTTAASDAVHIHPDYKLSFCNKSVPTKLYWTGQFLSQRGA